jgi:hypothetical protein
VEDHYKTKKALDGSPLLVCCYVLELSVANVPRESVLAITLPNSSQYSSEAMYSAKAFTTDAHKLGINFSFVGYVPDVSNCCLNLS